MLGSSDGWGRALHRGQEHVQLRGQVHVFFSSALGQEFKHAIVFSGGWNFPSIHEFSHHGDVFGLVLVLVWIRWSTVLPFVVVCNHTAVSRAFSSRGLLVHCVIEPSIFSAPSLFSFLFAQHDVERFRPVRIEELVGVPWSFVRRIFVPRVVPFVLSWRTNLRRVAKGVFQRGLLLFLPFRPVRAVGRALHRLVRARLRRTGRPVRIDVRCWTRGRFVFFLNRASCPSFPRSFRRRVSRVMRSWVRRGFGRT
mmetsp:Transcript_10275/g.62970  ORF Transcript_10275/g.62970 Transcript_10275/m.62970 type:complete len:252 (+) Transcript_10275:5026-5781(+)